MKKILLLLLTATVILSSCKKNNDDRIFEQSYNERVNATINKAQSVLAGAEYGWKAFIQVNHGEGGTYSFYMKFNDSNRVTMLSDFDTLSATTPNQSSFRLRQQQQPTLIFDTYSYVHVLADPNENQVIFSNVNGGAIGTGLVSDFEFVVNPEKLTADTLEFTGKVNGARLKMVRATQEEANIFLGGGWVLLESYLTKKLLTYYKRMAIGGIQYDVSNDPIEKTITFQSVVNGQVIKHTTGYYNTLQGVVLYDPLPTSAGNISQLAIGEWDGVNSILNVTAGVENTTITETELPLEGGIDVDAPKSWWDFAAADDDDYWISINGFHVNGVDDAFKIKTLTASGGYTYYFLIYYPLWGGDADLFAPVFLTPNEDDYPIKYGAAPAPPVFAANGILKFEDLGNYDFRSVGGARNFPTSIANPATRSRALLFQPEGFYFVKISDTQYDMVSAKDGKAWLRWDF